MVLSQSVSIPESPADSLVTKPEGQVKTFVMPDLKEICPWSWGFNPHYDAIGE